MRRAWLPHVPTLAVFIVMVVLAGSIAIALDPYSVAAGQRVSAGIAAPIDLPAAEDDADRDGYHDDVDVWDGNRMVRIRVEPFDADDGTHWLIGTQDDHGRFGAGRELEWRHVVDPDPLGHEPGSPTWVDAALRTGTWMHVAGPGPVDIWMDVREDGESVELAVERWHAARGADRLVDSWDLTIGDRFSVGPVANPAGDAVVVDGNDGPVQFQAHFGTDVDEEAAQSIARRWAPTLHFDSGEAFYPTDPALMERFHGFAHQEDDLRTWSRSFTNGRDAYRLLLADFDGDRITDHDDARLLWDILREGSAEDTIHARVARTDGDQVVIQYWFLYPYNFVVGSDGRDVPALAHAGDREFVQLLFHDVDAAQNGTPASVAFSQHYHGIRIDDPAMDEAPFQDGRLHVHVARGSHASYPVAGDDSRLRNAFAGFGDRFDGEGATWQPDNYTLETFAAQSWHLGYKWGPMTRFHRELGSPGQPLLVHSFIYPWHEPVRWSNSLDAVTSADLTELYGGSA